MSSPPLLITSDRLDESKSLGNRRAYTPRLRAFFAQVAEENSTRPAFSTAAAMLAPLWDATLAALWLSSRMRSVCASHTRRSHQLLGPTPAGMAEPSRAGSSSPSSAPVWVAARARAGAGAVPSSPSIAAATMSAISASAPAISASSSCSNPPAAGFGAWTAGAGMPPAGVAAAGVLAAFLRRLRSTTSPGRLNWL